MTDAPKGETGLAGLLLEGEGWTGAGERWR